MCRLAESLEAVEQAEFPSTLEAASNDNHTRGLGPTGGVSEGEDSSLVQELVTDAGRTAREGNADGAHQDP